VDTYEVIRIYGQLRRYEGANPDTLRGDARREYDLYREVKPQVERQRTGAQQSLAEIREYEKVLNRALTILRGQLGADSLTVENVTRLQSMRQDVAAAKQLYLGTGAAGVLAATGVRAAQGPGGAGAVRAQPRTSTRAPPSWATTTPTSPSGCTGTATSRARSATTGRTWPDRGGGAGNGVGIDGVAPTGTRLMILRTVPNGDERDKDVANAIRYAADNGAHVINMSFGKGYSPQKRAVDDAVRYAESRASSWCTPPATTART
jgi:hypothetical protein